MQEKTIVTSSDTDRGAFWGQVAERNNSQPLVRALWSLLGFDYQVDVSVWLALDIMVAARVASELTLEHGSEEDVETDIGELEPGNIAEAIPMHGYGLIVQAKRRTGNAWTEATAHPTSARYRSHDFGVGVLATTG